MSLLSEHTGLYTDHYELTMAQGYFLNGRANTRACFDYLYRENPFGGGYVVFAGLADALDLLEHFRFDADDCEYLRSRGFDERFLSYLANFRFRGNVFAPDEGEIVFPYEPILRVEGNIIEAQLVETVLLNVLNFVSLIATKASRMRLVAGDKQLVDFGLRRAQGFGGIHASRAAVIGGLNATSNVYSAYAFGLQSTGTQAHSWIESFDDELTAFRRYAEAYPKGCILLVDTYDTLRSGVPNAITVAKEMEQRGERLSGIRLDSGDLAYLSKQTRKLLDDAGLHYVRIIASNRIDEYIIKSLSDQGSPIDAYGIGTKLVTGAPDAALDGIYKLCMSDGKPRLKISEDLEKTSLPGIKKVLRLLDPDRNTFQGDAVVLNEEQAVDELFHPHQPHKHSSVSQYRHELLQKKVMENGKTLIDNQTPEAIALFVQQRLKQLPDEHKRFENPHYYKVGISRKLLELRSKMISEIGAKMLPHKAMKGNRT